MTCGKKADDYVEDIKKGVTSTVEEEKTFTKKRNPPLLRQLRQAKKAYEKRKRELSKGLDLIMHEASIALSVLEIAVDKCRKAGYNRIELIRLKIGRASGIMPGLPPLAFNAVKTDTIAAKARRYDR